MSIKYFVKKALIPNDGSEEIVQKFYNEARDGSLEVIVYPDIHYKKGSRVANGMLTSSDYLIYPSMLGVANCGFTFGRIEGVNQEDRSKLHCSFEKLSQNLLSYSKSRLHTNEYIQKTFEDYLKKFYSDPSYQDLFSFLRIDSVESLLASIKEVFNSHHIEAAAKSLGTLGGGNHFFELQYVHESSDETFGVGDIVFILHSDSISVGDKINLLFSNLSELDNLSGFKKFVHKGVNRLRQFNYFLFQNPLFFKEPKELIKLLYSQADYRSIQADTRLGRSLIRAFFLASVFGDMNRDMILSHYEKCLRQSMGFDVTLDVLGSHSHDSLMVEKNKGMPRIVQRNGVQSIMNDDYYVLPGALGTESYVMKNTFNEGAYFSSNHGVGRFIDKHIAKEKFESDSTTEEVESRGMKLFRIGSGNISEQNPNAFKSVSEVVNTMEHNDLGLVAAQLRPLCSIKG